MAVNSQKQLIEVFKKMAQAMKKIKGFEAKRDLAKQQADKKFAEECKDWNKILTEHDEEVESYCLKNRDELIGDKKKSGIVGPVTISFKFSEGTVVTSRGDEPDKKSIIEAIDSYMKRTRSDDTRALLNGCIEIKPSLVMDNVKKLPEDVLAEMGLKLKRTEKFSWKPNEDR